FLHVGDYDPSGESIFTSMSQDIGKFVAEMRGQEYDPETGRTMGFNPVRVALTEEQVDRFDLPTAPPKPSDTRSANWVGETTQAEALPPDTLRDLVVEAVDEWTDATILLKTADEEHRQREVMGDRVRNSIEQVIDDIRA